MDIKTKKFIIKKYCGNNMTKEQKFYKAQQDVFIGARIEGKSGQGVFKFYFDTSKIESKRANEKRSLIFELNKIHEVNTFGYLYPANYMKQYYEMRCASWKYFVSIIDIRGYDYKF